MRTKITEGPAGGVTVTTSHPAILAGLGAWHADSVTRTYWVAPAGGYVREVTDDRPGILGHQVCAGLSHGGYTLESTRAGLLALIRRELRRARREGARLLSDC